MRCNWNGTIHSGRCSRWLTNDITIIKITAKIFVEKFVGLVASVAVSACRVMALVICYGSDLMVWLGQWWLQLWYVL